MVCVGCGESPGVPLHPFESGSPICGWCRRLSRQRDDVRSSRTASKYDRLAQQVEQRAFNPWVESSSLSAVTTEVKGSPLSHKGAG